MNTLTKNDILNLGIKIHSIVGNEIVAHCPFVQNHKNKDKSPSFGINLISGKFLCRAGCIKGNSFDELYTAVTGKQYINTNNLIILPENKATKLPQIPMLPMAFGNKGGEYLLIKRGLFMDSIRKWGLMYWESINAVVIPIEQIGYIIRYLDASITKEKYKYVAGTKITNCLFGESKLQFDLRYYIIIVEGSLDTIWLHQLGYTNTLALLHTDISDVQMKILQKYNMPIYLLLDGDKPGKEATEKLYKKLNYKFFTKKCYLPDELDPNDCTKEQIEKALN